jgi:hypothetical protein
VTLNILIAAFPKTLTRFYKGCSRKNNIASWNKTCLKVFFFEKVEQIITFEQPNIVVRKSARALEHDYFQVNVIYAVDI